MQCIARYRSTPSQRHHSQHRQCRCALGKFRGCSGNENTPVTQQQNLQIRHGFAPGGIVHETLQLPVPEPASWRRKRAALRLAAKEIARIIRRERSAA